MKTCADAGRLVAGLALIALLAACGAAATPTPAPTPVATPAPAAFPTGAWTRTTASGLPGVVEFRPDGTWTYTRGDEEMSTGTYTVDATTLTFETDAGCREQNAERGTYAWTYADGELSFTKLDDACAVGRVTTFDGSTWTPKE
jgi:hypothetical protein